MAREIKGVAPKKPATTEDKKVLLKEASKQVQESEPTQNSEEVVEGNKTQEKSASKPKPALHLGRVKLPEANELIMVCDNRIFGYDRVAKAASLPAPIFDQIDGTTSGERTSILAVLAAVGYREIVKQYNKSGKIINIDKELLHSIVKDFER